MLLTLSFKDLTSLESITVENVLKIKSNVSAFGDSLSNCSRRLINLCLVHWLYLPKPTGSGSRLLSSIPIMIIPSEAFPSS